MVCNLIDTKSSPESMPTQTMRPSITHPRINIHTFLNISHIKSSNYKSALKCVSKISAHIRGSVLTHWGRITQICVSKLTIAGSDNGLSPGRRQAIIWTNAGILLIGPLAINFSEILIEIQIFSFKKMYLKLPSVKWRLLRLGLNVLMGSIKPLSTTDGHIYSSLDVSQESGHHPNLILITTLSKGLVIQEWGLLKFCFSVSENSWFFKNNS